MNGWDKALFWIGFGSLFIGGGIVSPFSLWHVNMQILVYWVAFTGFCFLGSAVAHYISTSK